MSRKRGGEECGYAIVGPAVVSVDVGVINGVGVDVEDRDDKNVKCEVGE